MIIPHEKVAMVDETRALVKDYEQQYQDGLITQQEKYNKVIDAWSRCGDKVANAMMEKIKAQPKDENGRMAPINSIYMMAHSGARGQPGADEAARRHARTDGQAVGRDHRNADHLELQGGPHRP
jgi:DNA-directed RNA polymerase subunit beta'